MNKALFIISVVANIFLLFVILFAIFTPFLDYVMFKKSFSGLCRMLDKRNSEIYETNSDFGKKFMELCKTDDFAD